MGEVLKYMVVILVAPMPHHLMAIFIIFWDRGGTAPPWEMFLDHKIYHCKAVMPPSCYRSGLAVLQECPRWDDISHISPAELGRAAEPRRTSY